jgi:hypothetical protein
MPAILRRVREDLRGPKLMPSLAASMTICELGAPSDASTIA